MVQERSEARPRAGRWTWILALWIGWVDSPAAHACAVCFGNSDDPIVQGVETSVLFMVVLTYLLIMGGAVAFFVLRRRSLKQRSLEKRSLEQHVSELGAPEKRQLVSASTTTS